MNNTPISNINISAKQNLLLNCSLQLSINNAANQFITIEISITTIKAGSPHA